MENLLKFRRQQNTSGASQLNSVTALFWTAKEYEAKKKKKKKVERTSKVFTNQSGILGLW